MAAQLPTSGLVGIRAVEDIRHKKGCLSCCLPCGKGGKTVGEGTNARKSRVTATWMDMRVNGYTVGNGPHFVPANTKYYHASAAANKDSIFANGLQCKWAGTASTGGETQHTKTQLKTVFNCRGEHDNGHVYFFHDKKVCKQNAKVTGIGGGDFLIFEFELAPGDTFHTEPEGDGSKGRTEVFRTEVDVAAGRIRCAWHPQADTEEFPNVVAA